MRPSARNIVELNIQHFHDLLETERDSTKREMIKRLLAEQKRMLVALAKKDCG